MLSTSFSYTPPRLGQGMDWCLLSSFSSWVESQLLKNFSFWRKSLIFQKFLSFGCCLVFLLWFGRKKKWLLGLTREYYGNFDDSIESTGMIQPCQLRWFNCANSESRPSQTSLSDCRPSLCFRWYWVSNLVQKGPRRNWIRLGWVVPDLIDILNFAFTVQSPWWEMEKKRQIMLGLCWPLMKASWTWGLIAIIIWVTRILFLASSHTLGCMAGVRRVLKITYSTSGYFTIEKWAKSLLKLFSCGKLALNRSSF